MPAQELIDTNGSVVKENQIQQFRNTFRGEIIRPDGDGYENARKIWNASVEKHSGIPHEGHSLSPPAELSECRAALHWAISTTKPTRSDWRFQPALFPRQEWLASRWEVASDG